jgi:transcriptional regulator with XRE-family HTH domain
VSSFTLVKWFHSGASELGQDGRDAAVTSPIFTGQCGKMVDVMLWEKLGQQVRDRRAELGLTQAEVAERGGPSVETLRALENDRSKRLSPRVRRALERVLQWETGSIDAVLDGGVPTPTRPRPVVAAADRFAMARQVLEWRADVSRQTHGMQPRAREGLLAGVTRSARQAEDAIIKLLPWLDDDERGEAIALLGELRASL